MRLDPRNSSQLLIFTIAVGIAGLGALFWTKERSSMIHQQLAEKTMTAVLSGQLSLPLSPEDISSVPLYHVHKNLWGTLLAERGEAGLAQLESISPDGMTYQLRLLPTAKFSNGAAIKAKDVIFSIRRLMEKQPGSHFNAKSVIANLIETSESGIQITLHNPSAAFLFLLALPEMGIIPPSSCDKDGRLQTLSITSGAYFVDGTPEAGKIVLRKNPYFKMESPSAPDVVTVLFRRTKDEMIQTMTNAHADFLEAYDNNGIEAFEALKSDSLFGQKTTRPSYSVFVIANTKTLTEDQRKWISLSLGDGVLKNYQFLDSLEEKSFQILPPGTFGSLTSVPKIEVGREPSLPSKIRLATVNANTHLAQAVIKALEKLGMTVEIKPLSDGLSKADLMLCGQGMNLEYPEIEFNLNLVSPWAVIPTNDADTQWINQAIHSNDINLRKNVIEKIGSDLLSDGRITPLLVRAYAHLYRKDRVDIEQVTNYDGDIAFWRMRMVSP